MTIITLRLVIASVLMFAFLSFTGKIQKIKAADFKWFFFLAFFEPYLYFVGETNGLTIVDSTLASVIVSTVPLFAPVFAFILLRERVGWQNIVGIVVSLIGVFFVIYQPGSEISASPKGVALMFLAVFAAICYSILLRRIPVYYSTMNVIFYQNLMGLVFFIPTFLFTDMSSIQTIHVTKDAVVALILLSVFASVIAFILFAGAVRQVGVAKTNVFVNLIPVFTALFSWIFYSEFISMWKWIGILIVIAGLFASQWGKMKFNKKLKDI